MRKNKMMRLASVLLVAVLLTTCMISGTFAKYVTNVSFGSEGSGSDGNTGNGTASVAKWDVKIGDKSILDGKAFSGSVDLFANIYDTLDEYKDGDYSKGEKDNAWTSGTKETDVKSGKIIAPGTWSSAATKDGSAESYTAINFKITNDSEVNAKYTVSGTFTVTFTGFTDTDAITIDSGLPLEISFDGGKTWQSLSGTKKAGTEAGTTVFETEITPITGTLNMGENTAPYDASSNPNGVKSGALTSVLWRWAFEADTSKVTVEGEDTDGSKLAAAKQAAIDARDAADTVLGVAAAIAANSTNSTKPSVSAVLDLTVRVEQAD